MILFLHLLNFQLRNDTLKLKVKKEYEGGNSKRRTSKSPSRKQKKFDLRDKLISKVKSVQEQELERQKNRLKKYKSGVAVNKVKGSPRDRSPSVNSISSDDIVLSDESSKKKRKKKIKSDESDEETHKGEFVQFIPKCVACFKIIFYNLHNLNISFQISIFQKKIIITAQ